MTLAVWSICIVSVEASGRDLAERITYSVLYPIGSWQRQDFGVI
jgi:hypothetical protein